jgi:hypothetical protein
MCLGWTYQILRTTRTRLVLYIGNVEGRLLQHSDSILHVSTQRNVRFCVRTRSTQHCPPPGQKMIF